jgi:hypothetical protein
MRLYEAGELVLRDFFDDFNFDNPIVNAPGENLIATVATARELPERCPYDYWKPERTIA